MTTTATPRRHTAKTADAQNWGGRVREYDLVNDFVLTAAAELDGSSGTATYGAPYTHTPDAAQKIGPVSLQHIAGVTHPINTTTDFVVGPLSGVPADAALAVALRAWRAAPAEQQQQWAAAYD